MKHRAAPTPRIGPIAAVVAAVGCIAGGYWIVDDASVANATMATAQAADKDCGDFTSQPAAQAWHVGHPGDRLDRDGDGIACESLPAGPDATYTPVPAEPPNDADRAAIADDRVNAK